MIKDVVIQNGLPKYKAGIALGNRERKRSVFELVASFWGPAWIRITVHSSPTKAS